MKSLIRKILNLWGYEIIRKVKKRPEDIDKEFWKIYFKCRNHTMIPLERMYSLYKAVEYVIKGKVAGDFVECGVWKGGSAMIIAMTLLKNGINDKKIYLYDTYAGMTEPTKEDMNIITKKMIHQEWEKRQNKNHNSWCYSPLEEVKKNMAKTNYPKENLIFVKGKVEDTIPGTMAKKIALLRLDTDWYESTKHEMIYLYPLLNKNGILIIDDYGCWAGSKKAVDEYITDNKISILLNRTDNSGGRIGVKS